MAEGPGVADLRVARREPLDRDKLDALFLAAWGSRKEGYETVLSRSFTWVAAWIGDEFVGFVNVAWDGSSHFFLLDTTVHPSWRRRGIGRRLVQEAIEACRGHGEWLHVDSDEEMMANFYRPCGFVDTPAGLIDLTREA